MPGYLPEMEVFETDDVDVIVDFVVEEMMNARNHVAYWSDDRFENEQDWLDAWDETIDQVLRYDKDYLGDFGIAAPDRYHYFIMEAESE